MIFLEDDEMGFVPCIDTTKSNERIDWSMHDGPKLGDMIIKVVQAEGPYWLQIRIEE